MSFINKDPLLAATAINIATEVERQSNARVAQIQSDNSLQLKGNNVRLQQEVEQFKAQLIQAQQEINEQKQLISNWIVSQKAFKELAIEFGFEDGLSLEEVLEMGEQKKLDVLDNKNNPKHGSNISDISGIPEKCLEQTRKKTLEKLKK